MRKESKTLYVAYGSNLNIRQMAARCPTATVVGKGTLHDYRLLFRGSNANAVATVAPYTGGTVPVLIWELTKDDEDALDRYEGYPWLYRKETVSVELGGKMTEAMIYIMNEESGGRYQPFGQPSGYYYSVILEGYKGAGFDTEILRKATADSAESNKRMEAWS